MFKPAFGSILWALALGLWMCGPVWAAQEFVLAQGGASEYKIVTSAAPAPIEATAAGELQAVLKEISGADFPIVSESEAGAKSLFIGESEAAKKCFPAVDFNAFKYDEILIQTDVSGNVLFAGHPQRGTLYAVYTFLEDTLGCRWWTSQASTIPACDTLKIPEIQHRYAPQLIYRESYYRDAFSTPFAARCKCNGNMARLTPEFGGHHQFVYFVHSFYPLIPPTKYFREHPEWFPEIDGQRKVGIPGWAGKSPEMEAFLKSLDPSQIYERGTQLCLSNDEMRAEFTKNALERLRQNPNAKFISISQNDWYGYCTCPKCRAVDEANGGPAGSLITFVNKVAEDIEKEFPDVWVETLAYQYTRQPPTQVRPRHNVVVRLCTIECSFLQPLATGELNASLKSDIEGWSKISPQLFVWNYITNFTNYMIPHPNMRVLAPNLRFFVDNKTIGIFEQGDAHTTCGDFVEPRSWVVSHLMWDPTRDENQLWDEFFAGYYGAAGPYLQEYLKVLHDAADETNFNLRCFLQNTNGWLSPEVMNRAEEYVVKAREAVRNDPELAKRVQRALIAHDVNWLMRYEEVRLEMKLSGTKFLGPADPKRLAEETFTFIEQDGNTRYAEHGDVAGFRQPLLNRYTSNPAKNPELEGVDWENATWVDFQDCGMRIAGMDKGWGKYVDDANASDARAVQMPGWHYEWAAARSLPKTVGNHVKRWHVYASVRCEATANDGRAMTLGIYDPETKKSVVDKSLTISDIRGEKYTLIDFGTHELKGTEYVWFAPPKRPDEVQFVYVDRFFLVAE